MYMNVLSVATITCVYIIIYTITNRNIKGPPGCIYVIYHPV